MPIASGVLRRQHWRQMALVTLFKIMHQKQQLEKEIKELMKKGNFNTSLVCN